MGSDLAFFGFVALIVAFTFGPLLIADRRYRQLLHVERMAAIEKGLTPPEGPEVGRGSRRTPYQELRRGLTMFFIGAGAICFLVFAAPAWSNWWLAIAILTACYGLAKILAYPFARPATK